MLTIPPIAPVTQARTAVKAIECLSSPSRFLPPTLGETILPFLTYPAFLFFFVRDARLLVLIARHGPNRFPRDQNILAATSAARAQ